MNAGDEKLTAKLDLRARYERQRRELDVKIANLDRWIEARKRKVVPFGRLIDARPIVVAEPWYCDACRQLNTIWTDVCGRCERKRAG